MSQIPQTWPHLTKCYNKGSSPDYFLLFKATFESSPSNYVPQMSVPVCWDVKSAAKALNFRLHSDVKAGKCAENKIIHNLRMRVSTLV